MVVDVSLAAADLIICNFPLLPKRKLFGEQNLTIEIQGIELGVCYYYFRFISKFLFLKRLSVFFFHRPNLTDVSLTDGPEQGGEEIIVYGNGFEHGGTLSSLFRHGFFQLEEE